MSHKDIIVDKDAHFIIDVQNRTILNQSGKTTLAQFDHNSERFTFEIPRIVEGHDMSESDKIEIHYTNISTDKRTQNPGVYEVKDMAYDDEKVTFSWLISILATGIVGTLDFSVRFSCYNGEELDYAFGTFPYESIAIKKTVYNSNAVVSRYIDVLHEWERKHVHRNGDILSGSFKTPDEKASLVFENGALGFLGEKGAIGVMNGLPGFIANISDYATIELMPTSDGVSYFLGVKMDNGLEHGLYTDVRGILFKGLVNHFINTYALTSDGKTNTVTIGADGIAVGDGVSFGEMEGVSIGNAKVKRTVYAEDKIVKVEKTSGATKIETKETVFNLPEESGTLVTREELLATIKALTDRIEALEAKLNT